MGGVGPLRSASIAQDTVRRALAGDAAAARHVYAELVPLVGRFVAVLRAKKAMPPELVADIVAEVFLSLRSFRRRSSLTTWAYAVTYRQLAKWERRELRRRRIETSWAEEMNRRPERWPDDLAFDRRRVDAVLDAVSGLRIRPRTCFLLDVLAGMPAAEVAKVVRGSRRSVHDSARYARKHVREEMRRLGLLAPEGKPPTESEDRHGRR